MKIKIPSSRDLQFSFFPVRIIGILRGYSDVGRMACTMVGLLQFAQQWCTIVYQYPNTLNFTLLPKPISIFFAKKKYNFKLRQNFFEKYQSNLSSTTIELEAATPWYVQDSSTIIRTNQHNPLWCYLSSFLAATTYA